MGINNEGSDNYDENKASYLIGYCFIPTNANNYQKTLIDTFPEDGGEPFIEAVFFVNADKDKEREIAILVRTNQLHKAAGVDGDFYDTYIYDNPSLLNPPAKLKLFKTLSEKFSCYEGSQNNKVKTCKFKNVSAIRATLKQMGY